MGTGRSGAWTFLLLAWVVSIQIGSHVFLAACADEAAKFGLVQNPKASVACAGSARASTASNYYVDSVHGSDSNPGTSPDAPWRTLAPVQAHDFAPGDVVHFKRGSSWRGGLIIDDSGVEGNPISFTTYGTGNRPVFRNSGNPDNWTTALEIRADWVFVEGFLVQDAHWYGVRISNGSNHNIIRDMEITNVGIGIGIDGEHNLVTQTYIHDLHMVRDTPGGNDDFGAIGVGLFSSNNEVSYNTMVKCKAPSHDYGTDGGVVEWWGNVDNCYVHHNLGTLCNGFLEVGGGSARNSIVAYNVSVNNGQFSYIHLAGLYASHVENFRVENNTIVDTNGDDGGRFIGFKGDPTPGTFIMRNNILYVNKLISYKSSFSHDHNLYHRIDGSADLGFPLGEGEQIADPLFVDLEAKDFHLQPGSAGIDRGVDLGYSLDFDDRPVPVGEAPDIGAFEYQAGSPTPTRTATPTPTPIETATPTRTPSPTPSQYRLYLPILLKNFSTKCVEWGYTFQEEFEDPALSGWSVSLLNGQQRVSDSVIHLWTQPSIDRFPVVWRNDPFEGAGEDFAMEARLRHSDFTAYGTTVALNSAIYNGSRVPAGQPLPPGIEDILNIHHVVDPVGGIYRFGISMLNGRVLWNGTPGDTNWHVVGVTLEPGGWYTLSVDGQRIGSAKSSVRPRSIYIGNPTIQPWFGPWTHLYVDYVRISRCMERGPH